MCLEVFTVALRIDSPVWKEFLLLPLKTLKSRIFDTSSEFRADPYSALPLPWTLVVWDEQCYGRVCTRTCYPWRFGSRDSTMYVVVIVMLIEHSGKTGFVCVCEVFSFLHAFYFLSFCFTWNEGGANWGHRFKSWPQWNENETEIENGKSRQYPENFFMSFKFFF